MSTALDILKSLFGLLIWAEGPTGAYVFMLLVSLISAVLFLYLFKWTSNQERIGRHKGKILGYILRIRIYQDNLGVMARSIGGIMKYNLLYLSDMVIPLVVLLIPLAVFTMQVDNYCGYQPLTVGRPFTVKARLAAEPERVMEVKVGTSKDVAIPSAPVRVPSQGLLAFPAVITHPAAESGGLFLKLLPPGGSPPAIRILYTERQGLPFGPSQVKWSWSEGLLNNAEPFIPRDAAFSTIEVGYERAGYWLLGFEIDAIIWYLVLTLIFALALKPLVKVRI